MLASFVADRVVSAIGLQRGDTIVAPDHKRGRMWVRCMTRPREHTTIVNMSALICRWPPRHDMGKPTGAIDSAHHERLDLSALTCKGMPGHDMGQPTCANQGAHRHGRHERLE
jgi:hypothetical protein